MVIQTPPWTRCVFTLSSQTELPLRKEYVSGANWACPDISETQHNQNAEGNRCVVGSHYEGFDGIVVGWRGHRQAGRQTATGSAADTPMFNCTNLSENIFILHNQRVGVHISRKEVLSVDFSAPLGSAFHILSTCNGNQAQVKHQRLTSNCACMHWGCLLTCGACTVTGVIVKAT